jgi:hypothetical protein
LHSCSCSIEVPFWRCRFHEGAKWLPPSLNGGVCFRVVECCGPVVPTLVGSRWPQSCWLAPVVQRFHSFSRFVGVLCKEAIGDVSHFAVFMLRLGNFNLYGSEGPPHDERSDTFFSVVMHNPTSADHALELVDEVFDPVLVFPELNLLFDKLDSTRGAFVGRKCRLHVGDKGPPRIHGNTGTMVNKFLAGIATRQISASSKGWKWPPHVYATGRVCDRVVYVNENVPVRIVSAYGYSGDGEARASTEVLLDGIFQSLGDQKMPTLVCGDLNIDSKDSLTLSRSLQTGWCDIGA